MNLNLALFHSQVKNRNGEEIITTITHFDIHDIARTCTCYGVNKYFLVHPHPGQLMYAHRMKEHWVSGAAQAHNSLRKQAIGCLFTAKDLEELERQLGEKPIYVATSARPPEGTSLVASKDFEDLFAQESRPIVLLFGTGHGFMPEVFEWADYCLEPIKGNSDFRHLSVRSAVSIILDRIRK